MFFTPIILNISNHVYFPKYFSYTVQKMKFSINDFFSKCNQIRRKLQIWSHLLKKSRYYPPKPMQSKFKKKEIQG